LLSQTQRLPSGIEYDASKNFLIDDADTDAILYLFWWLLKCSSCRHSIDIVVLISLPLENVHISTICFIWIARDELWGILNFDLSDCYKGEISKRSNCCFFTVQIVSLIYSRDIFSLSISYLKGVYCEKKDCWKI